MQHVDVSQDTTVLFIRGVKRYCKLVVEIDSSSDISSSDFLLLVQVEISEMISPVVTDHTRSILARFPSWTKAYGDSIESTTPNTALPKTNAGKLINALIGEDLDQVDVIISRIELDSFISSSDESQIAWFYVYSNIKPGFIKVVGNYLEMVRVSSMRELLNHRVTDHVFYYNFLTGQLFTLYKPKHLKVDDVEYQCEPVQQLNYFDDFGLKVGLKRLYLENNENFKKRILDVYRNPPSINAEGLKKTLRRELDIWRVYSSTPDSSYLGATPEVLEISDIEKDEKYFSKDGIPTKDFYDFVDYLNKQYPSNLGYAKWDQSYWDPAGKRKEGYSSIPQIADSATSEYYLDNYQPGVGDFNDIKVKLEKLDYGTRDYSFGVRAHGYTADGIESAYEPIHVSYDSYVSYLENYVDNDTATITYDVILDLNLHGTIPNNSVYTGRYTVLVKNKNLSSENEYVSKEIFSPLGFTNGESVYYNSGGTPYTNTITLSATESYTLSEIPLYAVDNMTVNYINSKNGLGLSGAYGKVGFLDSTPSFYAQSGSTSLSKTAVQINDSPYATKLKLISNIYDPIKQRLVYTPKIRSSRFGNVVNESIDITKQSDLVITPESIIKEFVLPYGATPLYVHIQNVADEEFDVDLSASPYQGYGGVSLNKKDGLKYLVSSDKNIRFNFINPNFSTPHQHDHYVETINSSTVSYKFIDVKFPYKSTPDLLAVSSTPSDEYPFSYLTYSNFSSDYIGDIEFRLSEDGVVYGGSTMNYDIADNYHGQIIGPYDFARSDFGLQNYASSPDTKITHLEIVNENDDVRIYPLYKKDTELVPYFPYYEFENTKSVLQESTPNGILNYFDDSLGQYLSKNIEFAIENIGRLNEKIHPSIESGFIYQDGTPFYLYADKGVEVGYLNQTDILLPQVARQGAPISLQIASIDSPNFDAGEDYFQVAFIDEASPTLYSVYNVEFIKAVHDNYLPLAYQNVFDLSIVDTYTNQNIVTGHSQQSNIIQTLNINGQPQIKEGRIYKAKYRVKNTYNVDNQYYDNTTNSYKTKVTILSTPDYNFISKVSYEKSVFDSDIIFKDISLNPIHSAMSEGYLYFSQFEYPLSSVEAYISPNQILDDRSQIMILNIFSYDSNKNPKPHIEYQVTGEYVQATPHSLVQTNKDGYSRVRLEYVGNNVATPTSYSIYVSENSSTPSTSATVSYYVKPITHMPQKLTAEVSKKIINANDQETVSIYGKATPNAKVYWRKGRNLFEVFNRPYAKVEIMPDQDKMAGMVTAQNNGDFSIGSYRAQKDATPGYWFVAVDTEMASATPSSTPNTVAGDIVYWYERYDVNQSNSSEPVLSAVPGSTANYYHYLNRLSFKKDFETEEVYYEDTSNNGWNLPDWYPIDRYTQYLMGLLGSTPYVIETYENLHPDYEEE